MPYLRMRITETISTESETAHAERHERLHGYLDELIADWLACTNGTRPSKSTVLELMRWSKKQTENPDEPFR